MIPKLDLQVLDCVIFDNKRNFDVCCFNYKNAGLPLIEHKVGCSTASVKL